MTIRSRLLLPPERRCIASEANAASHCFTGGAVFRARATALADAVKATDVRVAYLRHGNTEPNEVDFDRTLTKQGGGKPSPRRSRMDCRCGLPAYRR